MGESESDPRAWAALQAAMDELDTDGVAEGVIGDFLARRLFGHGLVLKDLERIFQAKAREVGLRQAELIGATVDRGEQIPALDVLLGASNLVGLAEGFLLGAAFAEHRRHVDVQ